MNPILYEAGTTTFTNNGICVLADCISCVVTEKRNDSFEVEFQYPLTGSHYEDLTEGRIICVSHDDNGDVQPFVIYGRKALISGLVTFYARHISYDLNEIIVKPFAATSISDAFSKIPTNSINTNPFTFSTDNTSVGDVVFEKPAAVRSILGGTKGSLLDIYGGEYKFDNFTVYNLTARGGDSGVTIRYGKDLTDLSQKVDISKLFNAAVPFWSGNDTVVYYDGVVTATGQTATRVAVLDLSQEFDTQPTTTQLQNKAQAYLDNNQTWTPNVNLEINFVALWQTEEYKDVAPISSLHLCDTVTVSYPDLGVNVTAKIVKVSWDALAERYTSMEVGNMNQSFASAVASQTASALAYDFVSKTGDTMTGDLRIKKDAPAVNLAAEVNTRINATAPSENKTIGITRHYNGNNEVVFYNGTVFTTGRLLYNSFILRRYDSNGENPINHGFYQRITNDGVMETAFTNATSRNAWRAGLQVDNWVNTVIDTTTITDVITVDSDNASITSAHYIQYGKVAQIVIAWTNKNAISVPAHGNISNVTIGTIVSGKRPAMSSNGQSHGDNAGPAWYGITTGGVVQLGAVEGTGTARTIDAGTTFRLHATYILP